MLLYFCRLNLLLVKFHEKNQQVGGAYRHIKTAYLLCLRLIVVPEAQLGNFEGGAGIFIIGRVRKCMVLVQV